MKRKTYTIIVFTLLAFGLTKGKIFAQTNYRPYTFTTLTSALSNPSKCAVDGAGNIYVGDTGANVIRKLTPYGLLIALAGGGPSSPGSQDGTGTNALFNGPVGVAVDSAGNIYVADEGNNTIRMITPSGLVSTLAGTAGRPGFIDSTGTNALFNAPVDIAVDKAGDLYVADWWNGAIRKITPAGSDWVVSTIVTGLEWLNGLAVDVAGNIYAVPSAYNEVLKITASGTNWVTSTLASGFQGLPCGVAVDGSGNVFVAVTYGNTLQEVTPDGTVYLLAGSYGQSVHQDGTGTNALFKGPGGVAVDSAGNLYVAEYVNIRKGWPASGGVGVAITIPPQSQTATAGANVNFTVSAIGTGQLSYQWLFGGQNIPNATNGTLALNAVSAGCSGGYSVVVSNAYGSVTSATASLAVLDDGANGNTPVQTSTSQSTPTPISGVDSLVLVTHGFAWDGSLADESWVSQMANAIQQRVPANWTIVPYVWNGQAWGTPDLALINAAVQGTVYGNAVGQLNYKNVHLISHSAGAAFIEAAAKAIKAVSPSTDVHETFLDPYVSFLLTGVGVYGNNADWADNYSAQDWTGGFTASQLENAYNVDVSWLDPDRVIAPYGLSGQDIALSSHGWPIGFYMETVTNTDNQWCGANYGFFLSKESSGWDNRVNYPIGNTPQVICSSSIAVQNPNPGVAGTEAVVFDVGSYALSEGANLAGDAGFVLNSIWSALTLVKPAGIHPLGGPMPQGGDSTNTPAWLAVGVAVTNAVNFVQFDACFTDTNAAQGLLTLYWNTNQIGMVDERVASEGSQTYRFLLPSTVTNGVYTLSFRLDSFDNSSSITVTNVATGFVGTTQPITLGISVTNGTPLLQLTAATNFTYLIESSTDLMNWTPTALLLNTNGTAQFIDSPLMNSTTRFYRAMIP